jgi:hypothetical protein
MRLTSVLELGQKLVEELELETNDTLGCWMAHFIAEKIKIVELASPSDRDARLSECCDEILKLWSHRRSFRNPPLLSFDSIFRALESLDPSTGNSRYFNSFTVDENESFETSVWLKRAADVDAAARTVVRLCVTKAAASAENQEREWVQIAHKISTMTDDDLRAISQLLKYLQKKQKKTAREFAQEHIEILIEKLNLLSTLSQEVIAQLKVESAPVLRGAKPRKTKKKN